MQIPTHPKYDIDENGIVRLISTNENVPEFLNRNKKPAVKIRGINYRVTSQMLARLVLRTFKPLEDNRDENWISLRYLDDNDKNVALENLEWDFTWYKPSGIPGIDCPLGTWFPIPGYPTIEITYTDRWAIRNVSTKKFCNCSVTNEDYLIVNIGESKGASLHRLIALTFLAHPIDCDLLVPNHKDSNPNNNVINNLEWATYTDNLQHAYDEGGRKHICNRVVLLSLSTGIVSKHPSVNEVARLLGTNVGHVHALLTHRQRRGLGYKGFLIKYENDPTTWVDMRKDIKKNQEPYKLAVRDSYTNETVVYESLMKIMDSLDINAKTVYRLLRNESIIPWRGKLIQVYNEIGMKWPNYPIEVVEAFSRCRNTGRPIKVTHPDGKVEYSAGVVEWCEADRENRCDPAVLSRAIIKEGKWRGWVFEYIDLKDYPCE